MGQGTLTGLAQLTAEELDCDWSKVSTEFPTPGQNVARKRVWGDFFTAGSQGIRSSQELVRKGGAAARMMLIQAAADEWKVPAEECSAANSVITHAKTGRKTTFGKVATAAAKVDPPKDVPLKDPKTWTIAGKPLKRLDTPDKIVGKTALRHRCAAAEHALCLDPCLSGVRRQGDELRRSQDPRHAGRQEGRQSRRRRRRGGRRFVVAGAQGARRAADRLGRGRERQSLQRLDRAMAQGRPRCRRGLRRQQVRRRQGHAHRRRQGDRSDLLLSVSEPRADGADERHGALHGGQMHRVVPDAKRRSRRWRRPRRPPACRCRNAT